MSKLKLRRQSLHKKLLLTVKRSMNMILCLLSWGDGVEWTLAGKWNKFIDYVS